MLNKTKAFESIKIALGFASAIVKGGTVGETIYLPSALFQSIASYDVVDALVNVILADPKNSKNIFAKKYKDM